MFSGLHRRGKWLVLFSDHEFDIGFGGVDDRVECDRVVNKKITLLIVSWNLGKIGMETYNVHERASFC